jgi:predicted outer membrane repeat protein
MHRKTARAAARTVALGGILALGLGSTQAAMARPASGRLSCSTNALSSALSSVSSGATIYLAPGCTYWLSSGLTDNKLDLTITGLNSTLRQAPDASDFTSLTVDPGDTLTLNGVNFTGGGERSNAEWHGGAIYNDGATLTVNGGTFRDNHSSEYGGAIYSDSGGSSLTVSGAYFTGNTAEYGGAIENGGASTATITNSTFSQNSAPGDYDGGAIENDGTANISYSLFLGNTARYGGAIENGGDLSTADNTLDGNLAYEGGGLYEQGATLDDSGSLIMSNSAAHLGGGIYNGSCVDATLSGTTLILNVVDNIYNHGDC